MWSRQQVRSGVSSRSAKAARRGARPAARVGRLLSDGAAARSNAPIQLTPFRRRTRSSRLADPLARNLIPADGIEVPGAPATRRTETGSRLATALLAYVASITAVVT